jgi:hypothetical protein
VDWSVTKEKEKQGPFNIPVCAALNCGQRSSRMLV